MIPRFLLVLCGALTAYALLATAGQSQARETLCLDGVWDFATDIDNEGEFRGWFKPGVKLPAMPLPGYAAEANGKIRVPGVWDNQGYGTATDKVHHNFIGKGWYKRQIEIPCDWKKSRVFLNITGVHRYAKVWIDNQLLGEHIGFLSVQEYDITKYAKPGKTVTITIQVDSKQRWEIDAMYGTCSLADYMHVAWGGIWGHVFLESRADCWLSDLFVQPDLPDSSCSAIATFDGNTKLPDRVKLEVLDKNGQKVAETTMKIEPTLEAGQPVSVKASLSNAALWTPESPTLYKARLSLLRDGDILDTVESRFGMRQFTIDGPYLLLNGKRIMLRGYGDDHIYPKQMAMPSDKRVHLKRLRLAKSYGFNFVRNHSAMMPPEFYDVCDEVGMIATAEFPICYESYLPGTGCTWKANSPPLTDPALATETYYRQWAAAIKRHRNHPSIFAWARGNELYEPNPQRKEFQRIARELDPKRFYIDSDSVSPKVLKPENDRDTLDFYTVPFAEGTSPLENPEKYKMSRPKKPAIVHESGNFIVFSRPSLIDAFEHNFKPFWLTAGKAKLEELGLLDEAGRWADKSERLYVLCNKFNNEAMRRNPFIVGYQWWLFQDYWATSNGIVDHYFRPKSITREEILKVNNNVVLLQDGLQRTYRSKSSFDLKLLASNFSPEPLDGKAAWEVTADGRSIAKQHSAASTTPQGEVAEIAQIDFELPEVASPTKLKIVVTLSTEDWCFSNDWFAWLYPAEIKPEATAVPVMTDAKLIEIMPDWGLKPIPAEGVLGNRAVYVTDTLSDRRLIEALERGACVVLIGDLKPALNSSPITFRPSWWRGTVLNGNNHTGTVVYEHSATQAMAPDGWCDDGWLHLVEGGRRYSLNTAPARPHVIIRALPTLEKVEDMALLFEVAVGRGCLIVSGLNHLKASGRPENQWLLARLLDHAAQFPQPKSKWPAAFLLR